MKRFVPIGFALYRCNCKTLIAKDSWFLLPMATLDTKALGDILWGGRWWLPPSSGRDESCEFVFAYDSSVHQKCFNYALTNLLFGLCKFMWIIKLFVIFPSPIPKLQHTLLPPKFCEPRSVSQLFILSMFSHLNLQSSLPRSLGVHQYTFAIIMWDVGSMWGESNYMRFFQTRSTPPIHKMWTLCSLKMALAP